MNRIAIVLLALLISAPAAAQDWERVFATADAPPANGRVLVLDPAQPRTSTDRYKMVEATDLMPAASRLVYVATAFEELVDAAEGVYILNVSVAAAGALPAGSLVLLPKLPAGSATGAVTVGYAGGTVRLRTNAGNTVQWADLRNHDMHLAIVTALAWISLH